MAGMLLPAGLLAERLGTSRALRARHGFEFDGSSLPDTPPTHVVPLSFTDFDQLFLRWEAAERSGIPHAPIAFSECYPSITVRLCEECPLEQIRYDNPAQVLPELGCAAEWVDGWLPADHVRPEQYCSL